MTDIDELYEEVSLAIANAEAIPEARRRDAAVAWLGVAQLERRIAEQRDASTVSGVAARVGAVRAAIQGRDLRLAEELATAYLVDVALAERSRGALEQLLAEVTRELQPLTTLDPEILPVDAKIAA